MQNNLSVNNESQFDQYANFDGQVEMQDNLDVYGDLSAQAQFDSRGIQDTTEQLKEFMLQAQVSESMKQIQIEIYTLRATHDLMAIS